MQPRFVGTGCGPRMCACLCASAQTRGHAAGRGRGRCSSAQPSSALRRQRGSEGPARWRRLREAASILRGAPGQGACRWRKAWKAWNPSAWHRLPPSKPPRPHIHPHLPGRRGPASASASLHGHPPRKGRGNLARDPCKNRCIFG